MKLQPLTPKSVRGRVLLLKSRVQPAFFILAAVISGLSANGFAEGFRIYGLSAEAQSRGEAVVASADDASAVWYNPAELTNLGKLDVTVNLNNMVLKSNYTNLAGASADGQRSYFFLPALYVGSNLGTKDFAVGLGVNAPFGLATEYDKTVSFRYTTTGGEITLLNFNPSVAYRLHPTFSVGGGLDYYYSSAQLKQQYPWAVVGTGLGVPGAASLPDGSVTVEGKGGGFGFNIGFLYQPLPEHSVGLTYRSQVVVKYGNQNATLTNIPAALQPVFPAGTADVYATGAKTAIRYPDIVALGYAYKVSQKLVWEIGGQWTNWDDVRSVDIDLDRPTALFPNSSSRLDWMNTFVIRTGVEYQCTDELSLSGGYFYDTSPTNEATFTPLVPDGNDHVFSTGVKYKLKDLTLRVPLVGILQTGTGSINSGNTLTSGKYTLYGIQAGLGVTYQF